MTTPYGPILPADTPRDGGEYFRVPPEMQEILNRPGTQNGSAGVRLLKLYAQSEVFLYKLRQPVTKFIASLNII